MPQEVVPESAECTLFNVAMHPDATKRVIIILPGISTVTLLRKRAAADPISGIRANSTVFSPSDIQSLENKNWIGKQIINNQYNIPDVFMPGLPFFFGLFSP
jgi:hypothetical protein